MIVGVYQYNQQKYHEYEWWVNSNLYYCKGKGEMIQIGKKNNYL